MTNHGCMAMRLKPKPNHPNGKRLTTIEEIKKNRNRSHWRYKKTRFRSVSRIGKNAAIGVLYLSGGYFERDKIVINK